ncbi:MAG TPA: pyridoxamine 5'-phosphate oxidase family protein [Bradyrhizobium sp.]|uniref:pyridoxamine 5'-phosphate oxidase family protein n=1 Tax=Bradyrhizobium sp. TaxID=376 RepID=UPI002C6515FD|nr:pyridoxamine 5'-phosphate oxidase family protein [Bradyrhizobium sp.]HLZ03781.1 pyridoxamine 5'-phosphate oxidase family protein [Bradyrhizobium sp.]
MSAPTSLLPFLRAHRLAVVSTVRAGAPQAAVVGIAATDTLDIIFDTLSTSRKYANIVADPRVALAIGWDAEQTVQIEGIADIPAGDELAACKQAYFAVWPDGRERERWRDIAYVRVRPRWLRYSDFSQAPPRIQELRLG